MYMTILAETKEQAIEVARTMSRSEPRGAYDTGPATPEDVGRIMGLMAPLARAFDSLAGIDRRGCPRI
ncbi:hypothetical protein THIOKS11510005 [Thiocapsa sp. KS1]|nr:hypothetical protein [Thiocapsa sp. KS1]CRI63743.1 hypothetical protein THIOKS11510005 [Thiocapsa sp. KS1]